MMEAVIGLLMVLLGVSHGELFHDSTHINIHDLYNVNKLLCAERVIHTLESIEIHNNYQRSIRDLIFSDIY